MCSRRWARARAQAEVGQARHRNRVSNSNRTCPLPPVLRRNPGLAASWFPRRCERGRAVSPCARDKNIFVTRRVKPSTRPPQNLERAQPRDGHTSQAPPNLSYLADPVTTAHAEKRRTLPDCSFHAPRFLSFPARLILLRARMRFFAPNRSPAEKHRSVCDRKFRPKGA